MDLFSQAHRLLHAPILELSAGPITAAMVLIAIAILVTARIVAGFMERGLGNVLHRRGVDDSARHAIIKMVRYATLFLGFLVAINSIGLRLDALLAASAALFVGIGFGLQSIAQNFISGIILLIERPVGRGDFVEIGNATGVVVDIGLRATHVVTRDEVTIVVPNSQLISGQVINHSMPTTRKRITIDVGVAYGSDTALVEKILLDVATNESRVLKEPVPETRLDKFNTSTLDFQLLAWITDPRDDRRIASYLRIAIDRAFRENKVTIPMPQLEARILENHHKEA